MLPEKWPLIAELAKTLGKKELTIAKWRQRGVPWKEVPVLIEAAKAKGKRLKISDIREVGGGNERAA